MKAEDPTSLIDQQRPIGDCTIPLFPLNLWLFPGVILPLQIFEPRYLAMISKRLKIDAGFGVVPILDGKEVGNVPKIHPQGVEVSVVDWYQQENGILGIKVCGQQRFRVLESQVRDNQLLMGDIEYLTPEQEAPILERHGGLNGLLDELKQHPHAKALELVEPTNSLALSYQLAQLLPFEADKKKELLMASDAEERLSIIAKQVFDLANA